MDPSLVSDLLNFSDEESEIEDNDISRQGSLDSVISVNNNDQYYNDQNNSKTNGKTNKKRLVLDMALHGTPPPSPTTAGKGHRRRHSLTVCETPTRSVPKMDFSTAEIDLDAIESIPLPM